MQSQLQGRVKVGEKRLCRLLCGKPLAFRRSPPPFAFPFGWKAQPSSRAEGGGHGVSPRKGEAFPHSRRQSRFGILPFGDFDPTLWPALLAFPAGDFHLTIPDEYTPHSLVLGRSSIVWSAAPLDHSSTTLLPGTINVKHPVEADPLSVDIAKMIG